MRKINIFSVAEAVMNEASEQNISSFKVNEQKLEYLKQICDDLELLANKNEFTGFSVEINENDMSVEISIVCRKFQICDNSIFCDLLFKTKSFCVVNDDEGLLSVSFIFNVI